MYYIDRMKKVHIFQQQTIQELHLHDYDNLNITMLFCCCCALIGNSFNSLPFIFLNPAQNCQRQSNQIQLCKLNNFSQNCIDSNRHGFSSVVTEYDLYCKIGSIGIMQFFILIGHILGCLLAIFIYSKIHVKFLPITLAIANMLLGIFLILNISNNIIIITLAYFLWALIVEFVNCSVYAVVSFIFSPTYLRKILPILNLCFAIYSVFNPLLFVIAGSWRLFVLICIGLPFFLLGVLLYKLSENFSKKIQNLKQLSNQSLQEQNQHKNISLMQNLNLYRSQIVLLIAMSLCLFITEFWILNELNRYHQNFITNYLQCEFLEIAGSILAIYICHKFTNYNTIIGYIIALSIIALSLTQFLGSLRIFFLCFGKILSGIFWGVIPNYTIQILPRFNLLLFYGLNYSAIFISTLFLPLTIYLSSYRKHSMPVIIIMVQGCGFYMLHLLMNLKKPSKNKAIQLQLFEK